MKMSIQTIWEGDDDLKKSSICYIWRAGRFGEERTYRRFHKGPFTVV